MNYNTIIVGGGVAGLTAGMYLARAGVSCLILEGKFWSGQTALLNNVSNYPAVKSTSGFDISNTLYEQVKQFNIDMKNELVINAKQVDGLYQVQTNKDEYYCTNLIIATGAKTTQLGLKEEKLFVGKGVSYCATCDGNFFKNKPVAVVGINKTAVEDIKYLHNLCSKIYWIIPSKSLSQEILEQVKDLNNLIIKNSCEVSSLVGETVLQEVILYDKINKTTTKLSVDGLFIALGRQPDLSWLDIEVKTNKSGYVFVDKNCQTSYKGVFACGDITTRQLKQIVTACGDGAIAASFIITKR